MREQAIKIDPFEFTELLELTIEKKVNEHAFARLAGYIDESLEDTYVSDQKKYQKISISVMDGSSDEQVLFYGNIRKIEIKQVGFLRKLEIEAASESYRLDVKKCTRTFQNEAQTYESVLRTVAKDYYATINMSVAIDETTKHIEVQYKETEWEFMKRLASQVNTYLIQDYTKKGCCINFGPLQKAAVSNTSNISYRVIRDVTDYLYKSEMKVPGITEDDCVGYQIRSREIYELCDRINMKNQELYVAEITTKYEKGELMHTYLLKKKKGMQVPNYYNETIVGASLDATVIDVKDDVVKVHILADEERILCII